MKNFAPFLKLYTEYVKNFDSAMSLINTTQSKNMRFGAIMQEIHVSCPMGLRPAQTVIFSVTLIRVNSMLINISY